MKIRSGFVANSSSSSFMVALPANLKPTAKNMQEFFFSAWTVAEKEDYADASNLYLSDQLRGERMSQSKRSLPAPPENYGGSFLMALENPWKPGVLKFIASGATRLT
jgi:hypothetical protein